MTFWSSRPVSSSTWTSLTPTKLATSARSRWASAGSLANAHPATTLALLPEGAVRPAYTTRVQAATPGRAHLGLADRLEVVGHALVLAQLRQGVFDLAGLGRGSTAVSVAFADLAGFTRLGEQVAISTLRDYKRTFPEPSFIGWRFNGFDGNAIVI